MTERIRRCLNGGQLLLNGGERLRAVMIFFHRSRTAIAKFLQCDQALRAHGCVKSEFIISLEEGNCGKNTDSGRVISDNLKCISPLKFKFER